jgi:hypothetical protein
MFACVDGWGKRGCLGLGKGLSGGWKKGQLIMTMGPRWIEVPILVERATTSHHISIKYCVQAIICHVLVSKYILSSACQK